MKDEPSERLDPRAKVVWRISGALNMLPLLAGAGFASFVLLRWVEASVFIGILPVLGVLVLAVFSVVVAPGLRWRRWRYEIRPDEVDLQRGVWWVSRTLVPLARIQHVDTRQGPLQRRYGLSTVVFHTAAGPNQIPELSAPIAAEARDRIADLTREQDEL
ncbi:MAG: PH domain-containing protein [Rubrobacter sp.]|nr:PH domain-containing protein [Rubrobacteraceae bacterium]MBA3793828.1 PH domain-containing protein [Rubrobacter sp.]MDQ3317126.1 PH domain-containing protein [Actinomycetota bacterium]MDQ3429926.1 PH domain-containing protein [Actinomycetota bacterium]